MEKEKDVALLLGVVIISLGALVVLNGAQRIAEPVLDCQSKIDSLETELFIEKTNVGRYEMALETFKEEDSVGADHFEHILSKQTE